MPTPRAAPGQVGGAQFGIPLTTRKIAIQPSCSKGRLARAGRKRRCTSLGSRCSPPMEARASTASTNACCFFDPVNAPMRDPLRMKSEISLPLVVVSVADPASILARATSARPIPGAIPTRHMNHISAQKTPPPKSRSRGSFMVVSSLTSMSISMPVPAMIVTVLNIRKPTGLIENSANESRSVSI
jgi:hypothetical protein